MLPLAARMCGSAAWIRKNGPLRSTAWTRSYSASLDLVEPAELHDARDVGQHVDPPGSRRSVDRRVDGRLVADVALDVRHALGDGRLDVEAVDGVAQVAEQLGGRVADAGGGSGDDDDAWVASPAQTRTCSSCSATGGKLRVMLNS